ncbi:MAG: acyl-ACP--UDP-N-acetylglucosamine O-acyltransferase [Bacteroidota bacterium]|nr:acyl-ACP--UDP-N-acetylglucosamine O-acyltransferase [Bacteroidota bacterium]MDQ6889169.1 acyl-ACP--UDP-N-acetylglucosamine O-acyltransferase [Bacteroidota bacterium]
MISPLAHIHKDAKIGVNVKIDPFAVIQEDVVIGENTHIMSHAVIMRNSTIGTSCHIFPGAVIGAIPQDLKFNGEETFVEIGNNTTIREFVTVNRGTKDKWKTVVGNNCLLMAYCHIAHDCIIGDHAIIANSVQLAGHVEIGEYATLGGLAAAIQFARVGAHSYIAGGTEIIKDIPPYIKAGRSPISYVGVNSVGLQRRGFSSGKINSILEIYRNIYNRGLNITQATYFIENELPESEERNEIIKFIKGSKRGVLKAVGKGNNDED